MNPEKEREIISKELYKIIRAGIVIPTTIVVAIAGVSCTQQSESTAAESGSETQTSQETPTVAQTETKETTVVKEVENIIPITLISDESLQNLKWEWQGKTYIPQEVVYKDPVEGPKQMEKALLLTWAYVLKDRLKDPDFQNIPEENTDLLMATLTRRLNEGEDLSFETKVNRQEEKKKVDLTQGVTILFVGELTSDFFILQHDENKNPVYALKYEVTDSGALTIKMFANFPMDESYCAGLAKSFEVLITQQTTIGVAKTITKKEEIESLFKKKIYKEIKNALLPGNEWEGDKWIKEGTPILKRELLIQATDKALEKLGVNINIRQTEREVNTIATTEEAKDIENIIPITLVSKDIGYQEPAEESKKAMEETFLLALAYIQDRVKNPDFQNIPSDQTGTLINKVVEKINEGKDLSFDIYLDEDYSDDLDSRIPHRVDLTKGVKIAFVDKIPDLVPVKAYESDEIMLSSRTFEAIAWNGHRDADGNWTMAAAFSEEVTQEGELTIKLYMSSDEGSLGGPIPNNFPEKTASWQGRELTNCLGIVLTTLICQEPANNLSGEGPYTWYSYPQILSLLNPGAKIEGMGVYGWSETGRPIFKSR
jgi:hypothetical protein